MEVNMPSNIGSLLFKVCFTLALTAPIIACSKKYHYKEVAVPERVTLSPQLKKNIPRDQACLFWPICASTTKRGTTYLGQRIFPIQNLFILWQLGRSQGKSSQRYRKNKIR